VHQVSFSCFVRPNSFSTVPRASSPIFMFCAHGLIFGRTEGFRSRYHDLQSRIRIRRYREHRVPFSHFALLDSFSAVPRASGPVFMLCAPGLVYGGTEGVGYHFHVMRARTHFRRYRGSAVLLSSFALPGIFLAVPSASGHVFMFCTPRLVSAVPSATSTVIMFYAPGIVSAVPRASGPIFMFCSPGVVFGGTEDVRSRFHVLRARTRFSFVPRASCPVFMFCAPGLISAIPSVSCPVFMFCAPGHVFGITAGIGSRFHVLLCQTRFRRYRGRQLPFSYFVLLDSVSFSCFALPDTFSAVRKASTPVFMFCAPGLIFGGTEGVGSCFHALRA
jgi:hypothetical protein